MSTQADLARSRPPPSRRRDKPQLSCNLCRRRKLKCDRAKPCDNCSKRGLDTQCLYPNRSQSAGPRRRWRTSPANNDVHDRIRQLEDQIDSMMQTSSSPQRVPQSTLLTPTDSAEDTVIAGSLDGDLEEPQNATFPDCSNWLSILHGLREGSSSIACALTQKALPENHKGHKIPGPLLLYGCTPAKSFDELLAAVPSQAVTNRLVSAYFNGLDLSSAMIHGPEFAKEYEKFWDSPKETPPLWLALLYGILCSAIQFQMAVSDYAVLPEGSLRSSLNHYRDNLVQCLIIGRYSSGGPHVMPAMMHYLVVELFDMKDSDTGLWTVLGILVNIAMQMGYDRDPSQFPNVSPYEAEMRRRWWRSLIVLDSSISESIGMQRLVRNVDSVQEPRNLLDSDFDATTVVLPPPRPDTEPTPMLYCLAKCRALAVFGLVTDLVTSSQPYAHSEVMRIDAILKKVHEDIPICYKWRPLYRSVTDSPQIVCRRMYLEIVYLKAQVVLHLKFVMPSMDQDQHHYSQETILTSVSQLLRFQHICDEETKPSGQLYSARWRYLLAVHQNFLLASIAACFYLEHNRSTMDSQSLEDLKKLCRKSQGIWIRTSRSSTESAKAAEALRISLDQVTDPDASPVCTAQQELPMEADAATDAWGNPHLPDYFGGFDLPFTYFSLFDGLTMPEPIGNTADNLLVTPAEGQSDGYLATNSWDTPSEELLSS